MPIFISYSRNDIDFVNRLSAELIKHNQYVWLDHWEMKSGTDLVDNIAKAIDKCSAFIIVLSKLSVKSNWCKNEITRALIREVKEKRSIIIPILIEDCEIPHPFDSTLYIDFNFDFEIAFDSLQNDLKRIIDTSMNRDISLKYFTDWSLNHRLINDKLSIEIDTVSHVKDDERTILCCFLIIGGHSAVKNYTNVHNKDYFIDDLIEYIIGRIHPSARRVELNGSVSVNFRIDLNNENLGSFDVHCKICCMGVNNGNVHLFDYGSVFERISKGRKNQYVR